MTNDKAIAALVQQVKTASVNNNYEFVQILINAKWLLRLSNDQLARGLGASRPTLRRWLLRESDPPAAVRPAIFRWIIRQAEKQLQE